MHADREGVHIVPLQTRPIHLHGQGLTGQAKGYKVHGNHGQSGGHAVLNHLGDLWHLVGVAGVHEEVREDQREERGGGVWQQGEWLGRVDEIHLLPKPLLALECKLSMNRKTPDSTVKPVSRSWDSTKMWSTLNKYPPLPSL